MIEFQSVSKQFKRNRVLEAVSLRIEKGERIALVGSNGAGKTTLIRCLLGEYACDGVVDIEGLAPRSHRKEVLGRVGFVPQLPPPLKMPVGQLIGFAARVCAGDPQRIIDTTVRLGLDPLPIRRQPFVRLSGGQKQKLLIGIALGRDADILAMDEPAANLDPDARRTFFEILAERRDASTMLISSHRLDEVAPLVNRVVELDQGKVVLDDRVEDAVDLASLLDCRITLIRPDEAFARTLREWSFHATNGGRTWEGNIPGPDRLRFLGMLSRHAGMLSAFSMAEISDDRSSLQEPSVAGERDR